MERGDEKNDTNSRKETEKINILIQISVSPALKKIAKASI